MTHPIWHQKLKITFQMKKLIPAFILLLLIAANGFSQTADEIIEKHIKALGGKEKYKSVTSLKISGKAGGGGFEFPITTIQTRSGNYKSEMTIQGLSSIEAYDSKAQGGWYVSPFSGDKSAHKMNEEQVKSTKEQAKIEPLLFTYKEDGATVEYLGTDDIDGVEVYKIMLVKKNKDIVYYYIETSNYLILKESQKIKFEDKEYETESYYSNYKTVDGVLIAHSVEQMNDGKIVGSFTIEKIEINLNFDDSLFAMPVTK
jgi:hypothetical protein